MVNVEGYKVGLGACALMEHFKFLVIHERGNYKPFLFSIFSVYAVFFFFAGVCVKSTHSNLYK